MKRQLSLTAMLALLAAVVMAECAPQPKSSAPQPNASAPAAQTEQADSAGTQDADMAPDFTLTDINGKPLTLSSLRGKYVVLDFWGSWCGWCIKGMPDMKTYYGKYKGKFEIVGIDCRDSEETWRSAVSQLRLPWKHVQNPQGAGSILPLYGIQGFPTKIIINPEGKIVKTILGEDPAFYTLLDELFK